MCVEGGGVEGRVDCTAWVSECGEGGGGEGTAQRGGGGGGD